jgi:hypothetical protein
MTIDIHAELAALRDAAERYRAEATALHAATLDRIAELEAKLTPPPKPSGLPMGWGLWWDIHKHPQAVYAVAGHGLRCSGRDVSELHWLLDPLGNAIRCEEPDPTRVQLTGPAVRFCEHGVVFDQRPGATTYHSQRERLAAVHLDDNDNVYSDPELAAVLGAWAVYTTPEHAAAWRRELGVSNV